MNSLTSLLKVCHHLPDEKNNIVAYEAERFKLQTANGKSVADVGCEPILHMRHFQVSILEYSNLISMMDNTLGSPLHFHLILSAGYKKAFRYACLPDSSSKQR